MTIQNNVIVRPLNLFAISSLCSLSAIPASSVHYVAGAALFTLGMACNAVSAMLLVRQKQPGHLKAQFASAAAATAAGAVSMAGSAFFAIRDIIIEAPASFVGMGTGFAMATGMISFYGGLRSLREVGREEDPLHHISGP